MEGAEEVSLPADSEGKRLFVSFQAFSLVRPSPANAGEGFCFGGCIGLQHFSFVFLERFHFDFLFVSGAFCLPPGRAGFPALHFQKNKVNTALKKGKGASSGLTKPFSVVGNPYFDTNRQDRKYSGA